MQPINIVSTSVGIYKVVIEAVTDPVFSDQVHEVLTNLFDIHECWLTHIKRGTRTTTDYIHYYTFNFNCYNERHLHTLLLEIQKLIQEINNYVFQQHHRREYERLQSKLVIPLM